MWNLFAVVVSTIALGGVLFLYHPDAHKVLSASRWMLFAWGSLIVVHFASPIHFNSLRISYSTWLYCGLWIAAFVLADNVQFTVWTKSYAVRAPVRTVHCSATTMRVLATLSFIGAVLLIYTRLHTLSAFDISSVVSDMRDTQLEGTDIGLTKTVSLVMACCGLVVALVDVCNAVRTQTSIPLRAGVSLLAYLAVPVSLGGRTGFVHGTVSLLIAAFASIYLSGRGFAKYRSLLLAGTLMIVAVLGYFTLVVSSRSREYVGKMDIRYTVMNSLWNCELQPGFRESIQPLGSFGDTISDAFYYFSGQLYGLDLALHHYNGPFTMGGLQFEVVARRVEYLFGIDILEPADKADIRIFEAAGVFPHFFRTAIHSTFIDFGMVLSIPFVFICGVLCRRARIHALRSKAAFPIALQALICSGMTFTIIVSPFCDGTFLFPLMWFIGIQILFDVMYQSVLVSSRRMQQFRSASQTGP